MRFPTIQNIAIELRLINANVEGETSVRLQVYEDGKWYLRTMSHVVEAHAAGQDRGGYRGSATVPGVVRGVVQRVNSTLIATVLLNQVRQSYAEACGGSKTIQIGAAL